MSEQPSPQHTILAAATTTGAGTAINVKEYDFVTIMLSFAASTTAVAKLLGSAQSAEPDWASAASASNHYDTVDSTDEQDGASIDGDTGVSVTASADLRSLRVDVRGLSWINVDVTAISAGSVSAEATAYDD